MNVLMKWLLGSILLTAMTAANAQGVHGILRVVKGDVQIKSAKTGTMVKARIGEQVFPKDVIITGAESRAKIVMVDNNEINVSPDSQIEIQHYEFDPSKDKKDVLLNVIYGKVRSKVEQKYDGKTSKFQVKTPSAVAGVRGTDFMTSYNKSDNSSQVVTFRGAVEFGLPGANGTIKNPVSVTPGKASTSVAGGAPAPPVAMPKDQLAKMDNDTKADGNSTGGKSQSSSDGKKDDGKKDDGKKDDGAKKDDGSGKKDSGSGKGSNSSGSSSSGATNGAANGAGPATTGSDRAPAAVAVGTGGGMPPSSEEVAGNSGGSDSFKPPPGPPPPPPAPAAVAPTTCQVCNQLIQNGKSKLLIHVN